MKDRSICPLQWYRIGAKPVSPGPVLGHNTNRVSPFGQGRSENGSCFEGFWMECSLLKEYPGWSVGIEVRLKGVPYLGVPRADKLLWGPHGKIALTQRRGILKLQEDWIFVTSTILVQVNCPRLQWAFDVVLLPSLIHAKIQKQRMMDKRRRFIFSRSFPVDGFNDISSMVRNSLFQ